MVREKKEKTIWPFQPFKKVEPKKVFIYLNKITMQPLRKVAPKYKYKITIYFFHYFLPILALLPLLRNFWKSCFSHRIPLPLLLLQSL